MIASVSPSSLDTGPLWLPMALMIVGVLLLGLICVLLIGERRASRTDESTTEFAEESGISFPPQMTVFMNAFESCAAELQQQSERLKESLAKLEQRVNAVESQNTIVAPNSVRSNDDRPAVTTEIKPNRSRNESNELVHQSPLLRSVFDLADSGQSTVEIARRLNEHVGTVELILALRKM